MPSTWPTSTDLTTYLQSAGLATTGLELANALLAAQEEFERRTGWVPAYPAAATRTYDAPLDGAILFLSEGLLSVSAMTVDGVAQVAGTDYLLGPQSAANNSEAYTYVEFLWAVTAQGNGISITGSWGMTASLPATVRLATLGRASAILAPQMALNVGKGLAEWSEGDVREKVQAGLGVEVGLWNAEFEKAVRRYRRLSVV